MNDFKTFLIDLNINPKQFKTEEADMYAEWETIFLQAGGENLRKQKLFLINPTRRRFFQDKTKIEEPSKENIAKSKSTLKVSSTSIKIKPPRKK